MKHLIRNFFNTLRRYKLSSVLNIAGMAVAFATFYIILTQVCYNFGFNKGLKDADRTFIIATPSAYDSGKANFYINRPWGERLVGCSPVVEAGGTATISVGYSSARECYYIGKAGMRRPLRRHINQLSMGAVEALGFEAVHGDFADMKKPLSLAVSESIAKEYGLAVGDKVYYSPTVEEGSEVVAIYRDFPKNSNLAFVDIFVDIADRNIDLASEWSYPYYVKLKSATDKAAFEAAAKEALRSELGESDEEFEDMWNTKHRISLVPLSELYYYGGAASYSGVSKFGNRGSDIILLSVAIIVIVIALINFINFFFALVPIRIRSVNTYKVYGVSRATLIGNFIGESVGLMIVALGLAVVVTALFARDFAVSLSLTSLSVADNVLPLAITIAVAAATAVLGALYPARYITSFAPAMVLRGSFASTASGQRLRYALLALQYFISITLIICAGFLRLQYSYMLGFNLGFDRENVITGSMPENISMGGSSNAAFEQKLRSNPDILDLSWAAGDIIAATRMGWGREYNGQSVNFQCYPVAHNFLDVMGIAVTEGRDFTRADEDSEGGAIIFNEEARRQFGFELDQIYGHCETPAQIAGFCSDITFKPLRHANAPFAFYVFGKNPWRQLQKLYIRTRAGANPFEVMEYVNNAAQEIMPDVNTDDIELTTFDKELSANYAAEKNLNLMIMLFTFVSIVISLMGVLGLALFETQHRSKEIALRRVLGASVGSILALINRKFCLVAVACFAVAVPVSAIIVSVYLKAFVQHISIAANAWMFGLALALVIAATLIVINVACYRAATSNPVNSIKNE